MQLHGRLGYNFVTFKTLKFPLPHIKDNVDTMNTSSLNSPTSWGCRARRHPAAGTPAATTAFAVAVCLSAATLSACGNSPEPSDATGPSQQTVTSTMPNSAANAQSLQQPKPTQPALSARPTASAEASSAEAGTIPLEGANTERQTARPEASAQLLVTGVRTARHEGFERIVFDLDGAGIPGWFAEFTDTPTQQASGKPVNYTGDTALNINIDGTAYPFEVGKDDPNLPTVAGEGDLITEIIPSGTFEGRSQFIVGLNGKHPYSIQAMKGPTRLVVDILH